MKTSVLYGCRHFTASLRYVLLRSFTMHFLQAALCHTAATIVLLVPVLSAAQSLPDGVWKSEGYGFIAHVNHGQVSLYELTSLSCLPAVASVELETIKFTLDGRKLTIFPNSYSRPMVFERMAALPDQCRHGSNFPADADSVSPRYVLDVMCANFKEQYAFSALRQIDFNALCTEARRNLSSTASDDELWATLADLVKQTGDAHVMLTADDMGIISGEKPSQLGTELMDEFENQSVASDINVFLAHALEQIHNNTESYLEMPYQSALEGLMRWTKIGTQVGYIALDGMMISTAESTADILGADSELIDMTLFSEAFDQALADLGDLPTVIVDLRWNSGGHDSVSLAVAGHFISEQTLAFSVQARNGFTFTPLYEEMVKPALVPYLGRLILLTSEFTASAAETLLLALMDRPNTYRVGETTVGIFSNVLMRHLPNGWIMTLSNEVYWGPDGKLYEEKGIDPNVTVDCFNPINRDAGRDAAIEAALELIQNKINYTDGN